MSKANSQTTPSFTQWATPLPLTRSSNEPLPFGKLVRFLEENLDLIPGPPPMIRQSVHDDPENSDEASMGPLPLIRTSCVSHTCRCHSDDATLHDFLSMESLPLIGTSCMAQRLQGDSEAEDSMW